MVQKYQSPVRIYKYPFELVMLAYERRFPTCPQIPVFVGCEVLSDSTSPDGAVCFKERRCKLTVDAPYLIKKIIGVDFVYFIQKNVLDQRARTLNIEATNETFSNRVVVLEKCKYYVLKSCFVANRKVHPENQDWTCFEQSASLDIKSFFGFENTMEKLAMKQYSQNISKGKEIIEYFVNELKKEGVSYVAPWIEPDTSLNDSNTELKASQDSEELELGASASDYSVPKKGSVTHHKTEQQFQLETDYIQRCLGELTLIQESRLVQLREWVAGLQRGKVPSDQTLLRFLRARDFNVEKAREMLSQSLLWRKKHQVDRILSEYSVPHVVTDYFPGGWHNCDKDGQPLYILRLGQMDVKGLIKSIGEEGLLQLTLHVCEEGLQLMEDATRALGRPVSTWALLVDLEGLNMRHLWRPGIRALLKIIEMVEANYPETMGRVLIIRAPRVFPILWTLVSTFIDDNTRSKFLFYGGNDYQGAGGLADYIPPEHIPDFLGGRCRMHALASPNTVPSSLYSSAASAENSATTVIEGGLVPKGLYMSEGDQEKEGGLLTDDSIYRSVSLGRGQVHEALITIDDPGSVITWDFDVMRQDVAFTVLRTREPVLAHIPSGALQTIQNMNPLAPDLEHRSVIDKAWQEGRDYFRVEPALVCHDGESIQGSHVASRVGTYVLQWKLHLAQPQDLLDSITAAKAQVMYYYEKLSSADYRGSMSSLQSGHSAFSALSKSSVASSCPSR